MDYHTDREFKEAIAKRLNTVISYKAWEIMWSLFTMCGYHPPLDDNEVEDCLEILEKARQIK
uniref:Uncharacterized protein n=1 Tax=viral metagenome TaxID=1070528 RepID=A0A6M3LIV1_9ZZZZ